MQTITNDQENLRGEDREQELERLKLEVDDLMNRLDPANVVQKAVNLKLESPEVQALMAQADDLRRQEKELSGTLVAAEVAEARTRRFDRLREDALAENKIEKAQSILGEKNLFLEEQAKVIQAIRDLNSQIEQIEAQKKALFVPVFHETFEQIKFGFAEKLNFAASWIDREFEAWVQLEEEFGIKISLNPTNQMRLFRENPWKETRERLDRWLP